MCSSVSPTLTPVLCLVRGERHPVWSSRVETHFIPPSSLPPTLACKKDAASNRRSTSSQPRSERALLCIFVPVLFLVHRARLPTRAERGHPVWSSHDETHFYLSPPLLLYAPLAMSACAAGRTPLRPGAQPAVNQGQSLLCCASPCPCSS